MLKREDQRRGIGQRQDRLAAYINLIAGAGEKALGVHHGDLPPNFESIRPHTGPSRCQLRVGNYLEVFASFVRTSSAGPYNERTNTARNGR